MSWKKNYLSKSSFSQVNLQMCKKIGVKESFWLCEMISRDDWLDDLNRNDPEWFYFEMEKFKDRTGMSHYTQNKISDKLKEIGIIDKELKGNPSKNWYRIYYPQIIELISLDAKELSNLDTKELSIGSDTKKLKISDTKKLSTSIISNKDNNKESLTFSFSGNWREATFPVKYKYIHSCYPKISRQYLQYTIEYQEKKLEKFASFFKSKKSYSDIKLINQIVKSCNVLDKLVRIDKYYFKETIVPALKWASQDKFWNDKILSLAGLRDNGSNGQIHFSNLHRDWCKAEDIDPQKGRHVLYSEVIVKDSGGNIVQENGSLLFPQKNEDMSPVLDENGKQVYKKTRSPNHPFFQLPIEKQKEILADEQKRTRMV